MESSAHPTFPISATTLTRLSLTPEFDYSNPLNARRLNALLQPSLRPFSSGEISASGLLGRIFLHVIKNYFQSSPAAYGALDAFLVNQIGQEESNLGLRKSLQRFPTMPTFVSADCSAEYLLGASGVDSERHSYYHSLILIFTAERNQAFRGRDGVFTDPALRSSPSYLLLSDALQRFFSHQDPLAGTGKSLLEFLLEPLKAHPDSLFDQLEFVRAHWSAFLSADLLDALLTGLDRLKEEFQPSGWHPARPQDPLGFSKASYLAGSDLVRFSEDQNWMPRVILLAKNTFVWLDQLSRHYQRPIHRLDQIPESEIARLAEWGITALWLIGLWERSPASQQIKQISGNPDAVPSAYSLYDYSISGSLGGDDAYQSLQNLASRHGIRLAADMVPNHMGIYSKWVIDHPDWFLSLEHSPYPGYSYSGQDLSPDPSVGIYLEDHYYDRTDAAVVFKRWDRVNNDTRYIYHGNDGTSMPWNDTAQLNFLDPAVREAVIQTIIHVAKKFPIIRFDAAMTLAKKHFQRLWFPQPGSGGAIPTRADFGMSVQQFNSHMPEEFWREVVDRIAQEVPDTLLLAEAFWMMEGYFVRTLGMHRVYNSAFMHMLRDEDNAKYRALIIQTLEYDPQILKRYVNFMNNPDEDTAISQFGSDGKYFGTCVLLATLPGLPMFGHGQIEGFTEKYGMEYRRAYYNEFPDQNLVDRHRKEIFPLLHKRYLFAEVDNFVLYDFQDSNGDLNQDVFAYSNRAGTERGLVIYHNKWGDTAGAIHSTSVIDGKAQSLLEGLGFSVDDGQYLLFRDQISGLEFIRHLPTLAEMGFEIALGAYSYHAFLDFKTVGGDDETYHLLFKRLGNRGVSSLELERQSLILEPLGSLLREIPEKILSASVSDRSSRLPQAAVERTGGKDPEFPADRISSDLTAALAKIYPDLDSGELDAVRKSARDRLELLSDRTSSGSQIPAYYLPYIAYPVALFSDLPRILSDKQLSVLSASLPIDFLDRLFQDDSEAHRKEAELRLALRILPDLQKMPAALSSLSSFWFSNPITRAYLDLNYYNDQQWYNKEAMESLIKITFSGISSSRALSGLTDPAEFPALLSSMYDIALKSMPASEYLVDKYQEILSSSSVS